MKDGKPSSQLSKKTKKSAVPFQKTLKDPRFSSVDVSSQVVSGERDKSSSTVVNGEKIAHGNGDHRFEKHLKDLHSHLYPVDHTNRPEVEESSDKYSAQGAENESIVETPGMVSAEEEDLISFTHRLALVDFEIWDCIIAADLHVLFSSFTPIEGKLQEVSIYVSSLGKENQLGGRMPDIWKKTAKEKTDSTDLDKSKVQDYKKMKRRFYYAVLTFDSAETAFQVYRACNGIEIEFARHPIVLEVIPGDMVFKEADLQDRSAEYPSLYVLPPILRLLSSRLQSKMDQESKKMPSPGQQTEEHSRHADYEKYEEGQIVELEESSGSSDEAGNLIDELWDTTDPRRRAALTSAFSAVDDMRMDDLDAYVASDIDEKDDEIKSMRSRYESLLDEFSSDDEVMNHEKELAELIENQADRSDENSGSETGEFTAEFTVPDEKAREELHRKIIQDKAMQDATSIAEKSKLKRKLKKKQRKEMLGQISHEEVLAADHPIQSTEEELRTVLQKNTYFAHSQEGFPDVQTDETNAALDAPEERLSAKEKRKAHKKKKQLASQVERDEKKKQKLFRLTGMHYVDSAENSMGDSTSKNNTSVIEDERFKSRISQQSDFYVDPGHPM
ncbi:ESF1-like protein [Perkinsela sp. CCAP 1560/4]|nr:ESF1-like protein [Perkinsela sp. CCAP 1560/4]|eukprot:KNH08285.1 ESF1-like protein [Perkinsela sp. CCAP 1560/4]